MNSNEDECTLVTTLVLQQADNGMGGVRGQLPKTPQAWLYIGKPTPTAANHMLIATFLLAYVTSEGMGCEP